MTAPALALTADARARLAGALLGAPGNELVTHRAADVRACLAVAEAVQDAFQLVGENDRLFCDLAARTAEAAQIPVLRDQLAAAHGVIAALRAEAASAARVPILEDQLTAARAQIATLHNRAVLAQRMLRGHPS